MNGSRQTGHGRLRSCAQRQPGQRKPGRKAGQRERPGLRWPAGTREWVCVQCLRGTGWRRERRPRQPAALASPRCARLPDTQAFERKSFMDTKRRLAQQRLSRIRSEHTCGPVAVFVGLRRAGCRLLGGCRLCVCIRTSKRGTGVDDLKSRSQSQTMLSNRNHRQTATSARAPLPARSNQLLCPVNGSASSTEHRPAGSEIERESQMS